MSPVQAAIDRSISCDSGTVYYSAEAQANLLFNRTEKTTFTKYITKDNKVDYNLRFYVDAQRDRDLFMPTAEVVIDGKIYKLAQNVYPASRFQDRLEYGTSVSYNIPGETFRLLATAGKDIQVNFYRYNKKPITVGVKGNFLKECQRLYTLTYGDYTKPKVINP